MCYLLFFPCCFNICSLRLIFVNLINMCLGVFCLAFILFGTLRVSWTWVTVSFPIVWDSQGFLDLGDYFLPHFREVFKYYLLKYFLMAFLFDFFFWNSYDLNVGAFDIVPEVSKVVLISFNSFFLSASFISTILSSTSLILSSASADRG